MRLLACATFALLAGCTTPYAVQERVALLDPALGAAATQTCSRPGPENPARFFRPDPREVTAIESAAMRVLRDHADEYAASIDRAQSGTATPFDWPYDPSLYKRQYIGYYEDGRRMIYGNYYPAASGFEESEPFSICDGGWHFFGVEYDVEAMEVRRIAFDGSRGGPLLAPIEP